VREGAHGSPGEAPGAATDAGEAVDAAQDSQSFHRNQHLVASAIEAARCCVRLRERYARAIERGDDLHAEVCRQLLDRVLNGSPA
jgi:hypothetical protein